MIPNSVRVRDRTSGIRVAQQRAILCPSRPATPLAVGTPRCSHTSTCSIIAVRYSLDSSMVSSSSSRSRKQKKTTDVECERNHFNPFFCFSSLPVPKATSSTLARGDGGESPVNGTLTTSSHRLFFGHSRTKSCFWPAKI